MKVWQVRPQEDKSHKYHWVTYHRDRLTDMALDEFGDMDFDTSMEVRAVEMSQEEFDALTEHQGW